MRALTREEYDFMQTYLTHRCGGRCVKGDTYDGRGLGDMVRTIEARQYVQRYACGDMTHLELTPLGKSAMQCYEFAHHVMDLAMS